MSALHLLAENNFGDTRSGGLAGPMGLFIIVLMAIATIFLIRNMTTRIKRLPAAFPDPAAEQRGAVDGETDSSASDGESSSAR